MSNNNSLKGKIFVFSGEFKHKTKNEMKNMVIKNGGKVSTRVNKETSYLVYGTYTGSDMVVAEYLGINLIDEDEFYDLFKNTDEEKSA